jgi:hypothetical protein
VELMLTLVSTIVVAFVGMQRLMGQRNLDPVIVAAEAVNVSNATFRWANLVAGKEMFVADRVNWVVEIDYVVMFQMKLLVVLMV